MKHISNEVLEGLNISLSNWILFQICLCYHDKTKVPANPHAIFFVNRPKYQVLGAFQIRRIILGPSGSGKSVVFALYHVRYLQNLFPMIWVFSLPREVDLAWIPVQTYIEERTKVVDSEEELFGLTILTPKQLFIVWSSSYKFWLYTHNVNKLFII